MASWNWPALKNSILSDIPGIRTLLLALLKQDPAGTTDVPAGAKRWTDTPEGKQFQNFNGSEWQSVGKLAHDAASVDGHSAATDTTPNTIPVRGADGKIPGDISGTAEKAKEAKELSETLAIGKGGTGGTTAEQARKNLGAAPTSHASSGADYGLGTESLYGHTMPHDAPDATLTAAGGHVLSPAGAAAMQEAMAGQISDIGGRIDNLAGVVSGNAASQAQKDAQQDAAIKATITSAEIDGLDLVLTYGDGTTKRVPLPAGKSVGDLWMGFDPKSKPANVQLYAGQLLSRSSYSAHWNYVNGGARTVLSESAWQAQVSANGFCPYYSSGDGSTTYRMPLIKGVHPEFVAALAEAGQYLEAGLPNITGEFNPWCYQGSIIQPSGAFYTASSSNVEAYTGSIQYNGRAIGLNASLSSPIYGNSDTVQPPSVACVLGEYVVGSVAVVGEADAETLLAGQTLLEGKVGALENSVGRASAYITETWSSGTEWYRKWSDGWIEQGGVISPTAETDSWTFTFNVQFVNKVSLVACHPYHTMYDGNAWYGKAVARMIRNIVNVSLTSCTVQTLKMQFYWYACGY